MNFEKYLIAQESHTNGFLGNLSRIPSSEIQRANVLDTKKEIVAMELYVSAAIDYLMSDIAMESSSSDDKFSTIAAKAKAGGQKIKDGKSQNNPNLIAKGSQELSEATRELETEARKTTDPKSKARAWTVAKIIGGITAGVLLVFGAVTAGKALSSSVKSGDLTSGTKKAKGSLKNDPILNALNKQTKDLEDLQKQQAAQAAKLDKQIEELDRTAQVLKAKIASRQVSKESDAIKVSDIFTGDWESQKRKFDEAMRSGKTISFDSMLDYSYTDLRLIALEAMIELDSYDLLTMNTAAMEATGADTLDYASMDVADKAKTAYAKFKNAKNDAERYRATAELDNAAKELVTESNKCKDPGGKARWKKVAKIVGAIAASVALIGGAVALHKTISTRNANASPTQAASAMHEATRAASQSKSSQSTQEPKQKPKENSTASAASSQQSSQPTGPNLTYAQKQEIEKLKAEIDSMKKKQKDIRKAHRDEAIDGTDIHRQLADLANARDAVRKKLHSLYGINYG